MYVAIAYSYLSTTYLPPYVFLLHLRVMSCHAGHMEVERERGVEELGLKFRRFLRCVRVKVIG